MWATPKTTSPSRSCGPRETWTSSFCTFPLFGGISKKIACIQLLTRLFNRLFRYFYVLSFFTETFVQITKIDSKFIMCTEKKYTIQVTKIHPTTSKCYAKCKAIPKLQLIYKYFFDKLKLIFLLHKYLLSYTCKLYVRDLITSRQVGLAQEP